MNKQITIILPKKNEMQRSRTKFWLTLLGVFVAVFLFSFLTSKFKDNRTVGAVSLGNFEPGYIISDWQMTNYNSMTESEIQAFLKKKNPCNNSDEQLYKEQSGLYPGLKWHWENGHFVCLAEEKFGEGTVIGSGETAAHIIWQAAQDYRINPQVLIVLLEKENGLITDTFPHSGQYKTATGYGCPDTAPCDSQYFGFKNQVRKAAALYREVMDGGWTNYPLGYNKINYNPDAGCGSSQVLVSNLATSALYRYTPYQPNAAALAAGHGVGDRCSAYGNRNFYLYFEEWFGNIKAEKTDATTSKAEPLGAQTVEEGEYEIEAWSNANMVIDVQNGDTGNGTNIQLYERNGTAAQKWQIKSNNDGTYTLTNPKSGRVLDVASAGTSNGTNVQLYESNGTCAQKWKIEKNVDGSYGMFSDCSGMALDLSGGVTKNGRNIQIYVRDGTPAQRWVLRKEGASASANSSSNSNASSSAADSGEPQQTTSSGIESGSTYIIRSELDNGKVIDIANGVGTATDGTNIQLYQDNGTAAQQWRINENGDGTYTVTNPGTGRVLDVASAGTVDNTNVQLYQSNGTCAQRWYIEKNEDGGYSFYSACARQLVLDVDCASTNDGTNIKLFTFHKSPAQKWTLTKI